MEQYIMLLKKALADETITVRLYADLLYMAPEKDREKFLELIADESDHQAIIADILQKTTTGESAYQEKMIPGIE